MSTRAGLSVIPVCPFPVSAISCKLRDGRIDATSNLGPEGFALGSAAVCPGVWEVPTTKNSPAAAAAIAVDRRFFPVCEYSLPVVMLSFPNRLSTIPSELGKQGKQGET